MTETRYSPVFLHGGWRCGSTYVWNRFRASPLTTCFYEPFAERLASSSKKRIARDTASGWDSHHPPMSAPYRNEYVPLLRHFRRGVIGYREEFALARYFPHDGIAGERTYLRRLLEHGYQRRTHPVFGFSRSLGRAAALKDEFGGYHIVIRRDPRSQWLSCRSYRQNGSASYFELCHLLILALAPADSPAGSLASSLRLPRLSSLAGSLQGKLDLMQAELPRWDDELSYQAFFGVYLLSYAAALPAANLVLDMERLGRSAPYRNDVRARILRGTGIAVDFGDCAVPCQDTNVVIGFAAVEADIEQRLTAFGATLLSKSSLSD